MREPRTDAWTLRRISRVGGLPLLWLATVVLMTRDYLHDPYNPKVVDDYGHNHEGALLQGIVTTVIELAVLWAILRPPSYDRSWGRALVALLLLVPWCGISMIMTMHAGGVFVLHFMWVATLVLVLFIAFVWSVVGRIRAKA